MSDPTPPPPDWLPYAIDRLKDVGLGEAAGWLASHLALVAHVEDDIRDQWDESTRATHVTAVGHAHWGPILAIVAEARGETPEEAFGRLAPTWHVPDDRTRHEIPAMRMIDPVPGSRAGDVMTRNPDGTYRPFRLGDPLPASLVAPARPSSGNPWAAAIDMAPMIERELDRRRRGVEDFLRENNADPAIHDHVIYPAPGDGMFDCGRESPGHAVRASRGHIHALIPWADMEGRSTRPTRDEVMSRGSRWPWRLI